MVLINLFSRPSLYSLTCCVDAVITVRNFNANTVYSAIILVPNSVFISKFDDQDLFKFNCKVMDS